MSKKKKSLYDTQEIDLNDIPTYTLPEDGAGNGGDIYIGKQRSQPNPQPPSPDKPEKRKNKKKKHPLIKAFIITPLTILAVAFVAIFFFAASVDYTREDLEKNEYISSAQLSNSAAVTNILFIGNDGTSSSEGARSDSMILVSVDYKHAKIKLTSFLRDSWVEIPSKGKKAKLNAACAYGGPQLLVDTIEYNFHIDIDHYVMVNFEMFTQIIDNLGGVEVEVTEKEAKFIRNTTRHKDMESGDSVLLDGAKALVYCRIRKLDSDYMRTLRQRKVITALINKATETDIQTLFEAVNKVFPLIQTDMNAAEISAMAFKGGFGIVAFDIQQTRAPIEEHMEATTIGGQWVEVLELEKVREYIHDFIYTNKIDPDETKTEG